MEYGVIYTYSILYASTEKYAHLLPYVTAIIELSDGRRLPALLQGYVEGKGVGIGQTVQFVGTSESGEPIFSL